MSGSDNHTMQKIFFGASYGVIVGGLILICNKVNTRFLIMYDIGFVASYIILCFIKKRFCRKILPCILSSIIIINYMCLLNIVSKTHKK